MKILVASVSAALLIAGSAKSDDVVAAAQPAIILTCEQGHVNSWKICEVRPEGYASYIWTASNGAVLDPFVCTTTSTACTAYCSRGSTSGKISVSIYDSNHQLVGARSKSLGCVG